MLRCVCCLSLRLSFIFSPIESDVFSPSTFHPIPLHPPPWPISLISSDGQKGGLHGKMGSDRPSAALGFPFISNDCLFTRPVCVSSVTSFRTLSPLLFSTPDSLNSLLAATEWAIWSYEMSKEKLASHPKLRHATVAWQICEFICLDSCTPSVAYLYIYSFNRIIYVFRTKSLDTPQDTWRRNVILANALATIITFCSASWSFWFLRYYSFPSFSAV